MNQKTCLILNELAILMRYDKRDFKKRTVIKTLVVSLKMSVSKKNSQGDNISLQKTKDSQLQQEPLSQPVFSVELLNPDLIEQTNDSNNCQKISKIHKSFLQKACYSRLSTEYSHNWVSRVKAT